MKIKQLLPYITAICAVVGVFTFTSCEEDFSTVESNVIDQNLTIPDTVFDVIAYSRNLMPVQTNGLSSYQLGVYNDPFYGKTISNVLSQVSLTTTGPTFGDSATVTSVILYVPYFTTSSIENDSTVYAIDSIYGNTPYKLNIYESNYYLRDLDPDSNFEESQNYYSNQRQLFESYLGEKLLEIEEFKPSAAPYVINEGEDDETTLAPGLRVELPAAYFQEKILEQEGTENLISNNNFKDYFRGLYFQVEETTGGDNLIYLDVDGASITINYEFDVEVTDENGDTSIEAQESAYSLSLAGIKVNTFENNIPGDVLQKLQNPNTAQGEENLFVKSNAAITYIELFGEDLDGNGTPDLLEDLRNEEWLINDAVLKFYVDQSKVAPGSREPERLVVFNVDDETFLTDTNFDPTASASDLVNAYTTHMGRLERGSDEAGDFYKIRITNHVSNLINRDSSNVTLGLMVAENVTLTGFQDTESSQPPGLESVPRAAVEAHEGTVLFGNNTSNEDKRLKLEIYYTKPE